MNDLLDKLIRQGLVRRQLFNLRAENARLALSEYMLLLSLVVSRRPL